MRNGVVYFSLAIIGNESNSKKYLVQVSISSEIDKVCSYHIHSYSLFFNQFLFQVSKIRWTIPSHSILSSEEEIMDKCCAIVPFNYIKAHSKSITLTSNSKSLNKKPKLKFYVEYKIILRNIDDAITKK